MCVCVRACVRVCVCACVCIITVISMYTLHRHRNKKHWAQYWGQELVADNKIIACIHVLMHGRMCANVLCVD